jgi:N-acetylglucosaminyl-diphospho-decaprenol L-rhamnosyltransferase
MNEKVIAAVPSYNAGKNLLNLAEQLSNQNFDAVYILNDNSTDNSIEKLKNQYPDFSVVEGSENIGPAGNRNRVLDVVDEGTILFIDADMTLESENILQAVKGVLANTSVGMAGGYILNRQKQPMGWNYGFEMHLRKDVWFWHIVSTIARQDIPSWYKHELLQQLKDADMDYHWVAPADLPLQSRKVDWVAEGLFAIEAKLFRQVGGYDDKMPYHEGQDLARRVRDEGLDVKFEPSFSSVHHELHVRHDRDTDFREGQFYFFQKHWDMSQEVFEKLY